MTKEKRRKKLALTPEDNKSLIVLAYVAALIGLGLGLLMYMHSDLSTRFLTYIHAELPISTAAPTQSVSSGSLIVTNLSCDIVAGARGTVTNKTGFAVHGLQVVCTKTNAPDGGLSPGSVGSIDAGASAPFICPLRQAGGTSECIVRFLENGKVINSIVESRQ